VISVVIPTKNEAERIGRCLEAIARQELDDHDVQVIVIDSGSEDDTVQIAEAHSATVHRITAEEFGHGRTRNLGACLSNGEAIVFLNADAEPVGERWLSALITPLNKDRVVATFSRQVARPDANPWEASLLGHLYPATPATWSMAHPAKGLRVVFSTVAGAVTRQAWERHPFDHTIDIAEDQQWAEETLRSGYSIRYTPDSVVVHSHNYGLRNSWIRYRRLGRVRATRVSTVAGPGVGLSSSLGLARLAASDVLGELRRGHVMSSLHAGAANGSRILGYIAGIAEGRFRVPKK